jgi:hypothetical protein
VSCTILRKWLLPWHLLLLWLCFHLMVIQSGVTLFSICNWRYVNKLWRQIAWWCQVLVNDFGWKTIRSQPWSIHIILLVFFGGSVVTLFLETQFDHVSCIFHSWNLGMFFVFCFPMCPFPLLWEQDGFEPPNYWLLWCMNVICLH